MERDSKTIKEQFFEWLYKYHSDEKKLDIYLSYRGLEKVLLDSHFITKPLFETVDLSVIKTIINAFNSNTMYAVLNTKQFALYRRTISLYYQFTIESECNICNHSNDNKNVNELIYDTKTFMATNKLDDFFENPQKQEKIVSDDMLNYLNQNNVDYVDNRNQGGFLWVIGKYEMYKIISFCKSNYNVTFKYKSEGSINTKNKSGWYTKDITNSNNNNSKWTYRNKSDNNKSYNTITTMPKCSQAIADKPSKPLSNTDNIVNNNAQLEISNLYVEVLHRHFPKGYRLDSVIDIKRFIGLFNEISKEKLDFNDEYLKEKVKKQIMNLCIIYEGRAFLPESLVNDVVKDKMFQYINKALNSGINVLYFKAIFTEFSEELLNQRIYSEDMLREYLFYFFKNKYHFETKYLSIHRDTQEDLKGEIKNVMLSYGVPVKLEVIFNKLSNYPSDKIENTIHFNIDFICNCMGEYFYVSLIDFTDKELEQIEELISYSINNYGYAIGIELISNINKKYPEMLERFSEFSNYGIRNAIAFYLRKKFCFKNNIISAFNNFIDLKNIFIDFAKSHDDFTLSELNSIKSDFNSNIYFDEIYHNSVRISKEQFVSDSQVKFNVHEIDSVLKSMCNNKYISLNEIKSFGLFPYCGFQWNTYLLESYVYRFSCEFILVHKSFNSSSCVGTIVKKNSGITNFNSLVVDALAHTDRPLANSNDALQFLSDKGYIAHKVLKNIDQLLIRAKLQKG